MTSTTSADTRRWETHPLTSDRFDDFADVINRSRRATHCWCTTHRLTPAEIEEIGGGDRECAMRELAASELPPGVIAYADGVPVGWCNIGPRRVIGRLRRSRLIRPVDDMDVWSIVCTIVRPGHRKTGVTQHLIAGAVDFAAARGAPAVEVYPVDPDGRVDLTMSFVGVRAMYDRAGFSVIGTTDAVAAGLPRIVMRKLLDS